MGKEGVGNEVGGAQGAKLEGFAFGEEGAPSKPSPCLLFPHSTSLEEVVEGGGWGSKLGWGRSSALSTGGGDCPGNPGDPVSEEGKLGVLVGTRLRQEDFFFMSLRPIWAIQFKVSPSYRVRLCTNKNR